MTPLLKGWPTKVKETPFPPEVRLTPPDANPVFQCLGLGLLLPTRKLEPGFVPWSFFHRRFFFICISLQNSLTLNTAVISGLVLLTEIWIWLQISYRNGYVRLLILHLLPIVNSWLIVTIASLSISIVITLVDVHLNWLNWFWSLIFMEDHSLF